jgi:hypothetical protein
MLSDGSTTKELWLGGMLEHSKIKTQSNSYNREPRRKISWGCKRGCGPSQFELTNDASIDKFGLKECGVGSKSVSSSLICATMVSVTNPF